MAKGQIDNVDDADELNSTLIYRVSQQALDRNLAKNL